MGPQTRAAPKLRTPKKGAILAVATQGGPRFGRVGAVGIGTIDSIGAVGARMSDPACPKGAPRRGDSNPPDTAPIDSQGSEL